MNGCEYETPKPDGIVVVVPSGRATEIAYQLAMWFAVSVIESTAVSAEPSAGLEPTNSIGGGGRRRRHARGAVGVDEERAHALELCRGRSAAAAPGDRDGLVEERRRALPARSFVAVPE